MVTQRERLLRTHDDLIRMQREMPQRLCELIDRLKTVPNAGGTNERDHSLQAATRAYRAGADDELVFCALCHDIGKVFGQLNHSAIAAEIIRPYVSEASYHIVRTHEDFQGRFYYGRYGMNPDTYMQYSAELWFAAALRFSDEWDITSFDPRYPNKPLEEFVPLLVKYCGREFPWVLKLPEENVG